jgi:hypothetical protein
MEHVAKAGTVVSSGDRTQDEQTRSAARMAKPPATSSHAAPPPAYNGFDPRERIFAFPPRRTFS